MFTQISAKSGIKKFGEKAMAAMVKDYIYIDKGPIEGKPVVTPIDPDTLYYKEKRKALELVNLIKEKIKGIIKVRVCEYGSKQKKLLKGRRKHLITHVILGGSILHTHF